MLMILILITSFSISLCLLFKKFKLGFSLHFQSLLFLCELDLVIVLFLLNNLVQLCTLCLPRVQFRLVFDPPLECFIHNVPVFLQLRYFNLVLIQFIVPPLPQIPDLPLEFRHRLIVHSLVRLFELRDLVLQRYRLLQLLVIFKLQLTFDLRLVQFLLGEAIVQGTDHVLELFYLLLLLV